MRRSIFIIKSVFPPQAIDARLYIFFSYSALTAYIYACHLTQKTCFKNINKSLMAGVLVGTIFAHLTY